MKIATVMVSFAGLASLAAGEPGGTTHRLTAQLKEEFQFDAVARPPNAAPLDEEVVVMERFTVTESIERRHLERIVKEQERRWKDERYSMTRGGTMIKKDVGAARIEAGTWVVGPGLGLIRISW
jgi:hypothetical protein